MWFKFRPSGRPFLVLTWLWLATRPAAIAQVSWTPIYVDGKNQVDLWTREAKGCPCPWDANDQSCACCVKDGGCHCGKESPNRCTQCGLESHCSNMCNITIQSEFLKSQSGKTFGQIKSPSFEGPDFCWYTFVPAAWQRVELQIYRLISVGKYNGTSCESGYLQLVDGLEPLPNTQDIQVCGANERYTPPVVLFADEGPASLLFLITEKTLRSQFLAYYSFTPSNNSQSLGFQPRGGMRLQNTDCDWLYQDFSCRKSGSCVLASPGYPGLYPPHRQCKYHITTSSIHTRVRITFKTLLLPHNLCTTDYIAVYQGSALTSPLLTTLCGNRKTVLEYSGPNLLIEFSSGPQVPPFDYNGFLASLEFRESSTSTESSVTLATHSVEGVATVDGTVSSSRPGCEVLILGNNTRSGHFDTRHYEWHSNCRVVFRGRSTDIVHISFFNYRLRSPACRSVIEVVDGPPRDAKKTLKKLCSPQTKHARDSGGRFLEQQTFISTGNVMSLLLRRPTAANDAEFIDGAFLFHDEQISGTLQPNTMCDVLYYGMSSPSVGMIDSPGSQDVYWNVEGPLRCSQQFVPAANQSISITILSLGRLSADPYCQTQCGDSGCRCVPTGALRNTDHLLLIAEYGREVACLCGDFLPEWLTVSVRSWGPITVRYSVAHYTWNRKGFAFSASYNFNTDSICGHHTVTVHTGEITSKNFTSTDPLNHFYHQSCTWTLDSNVERQLEVEVSSSQNRPCTAWNISIHEFSPNAEDHHLGDMLHTFCPRERRKTYSLPWKLNTVIVRVRALSRTPPQFKVKWKSQVVRANTRLGAPTPAPNAISNERRFESNALGIFTALIFASFYV